MYLRDTDFDTLETVAGHLHDSRLTWSGSSVDVRVRLHDGTEETDLTDENADEGAQRVGTIVLGKHEMPATASGIQALANYYDVPYKFLERVPDDEKQFILDHRIQRSADTPLVIKWSAETGITEAYRATIQRIDPEQYADKLLEYFPGESPVVEWWNNADEFRLDLIVPEDYDKGIGGDRKVGDLTHGGVRIGQNRKQNLAPWVQPYMFRLACTNGMEVPDTGLRVDSRGMFVEDILNMLGAEARRAFDRVEGDIKHFYDLRSVKVGDDRTGIMRRMAQEAGIPDRTIGHLEDTLADALLAEDEVSMFHLANHITNRANDPLIRHQYNARRTLERAGGQMISDHAARCAACHSRLN